MAGFVRRFLFDPGLEELTAIEGVVIIDREPPASITGVGTGTAHIVGEFEKGPFADPVEVASGGDFLTTFGGFGFEYAGVPSQNPSARARLADGAIVNEFWNGNGFIALANKRFRRLIVTRVDTSVGEVSFTRLACLEGSPNPTFDLEPGEILDFDIGAGTVTATFTATAAALASAVGTYPTTFTGGESMTLLIDDGTSKQVGPVTVVFQATDQTQADVINRINAALGYTAAVDSGGNVTTITGRVRGSDGEVRVTAVSGAIVTTATGFSVSSAAGTGNVADIDQVTVTEVDAVVNAASASVNASRNADGNLQLCNTGTPGTGTLEVEATTTATGLGFTLGATADAAAGEDGVLTAGSRVRNVGGDEWVTMQDVTIAADDAGPYTVKIRPATDDGTQAAAGVGTIITSVDADTFSVTNLLPVSEALSEAAIDALYVLALAETKKLNGVQRETNIIWSARQSNAIRSQLRTNALDASANGGRGRRSLIRPPLSTTTRTIARGTSQPGVGAYRDQRVGYCFPGVATFIPQIALRGTAGGDGFTDNGIVDVGFDSFVASIFSQLPPEENPGQETTFTTGIVSLELNNPDVQDLDITDYRNFRASGIMAPRIDNVPIIQSGVTSVDPAVQPNLRNQNRRAMADFIQDTLAERMKPFTKQLATRSRRAQILGEITEFLSSLLSADNPDLQRIDSFVVDGITGNTPSSLAAGVFRVIIKVRTLPSLDVIVLDTEIGESVQITEQAA